MKTLPPADTSNPIDLGGTALDRLIIQDATAHLATASPQGQGDVLVLDDPAGALTRWALEHTQTGRVFSRQRSYADAQNMLALRASLGETGATRLLIAGLDGSGEVETATFGLHDFLARHEFSGGLALGHLPKSHAALTDVAHGFAAYQQAQRAQGALILGGNTRHMNRSFNTTLARSFAQVTGLRGQGKHRCLLASDPAPAQQAPRLAGELPAVGGVFSGGRPDRGGNLLAQAALADLESLPATDPLTMLDLGCGNGSVTQAVLHGLPAGLQVAQAFATDLDLDAARSSHHLLGKDARVQVSWDNAGARIPAGSVDVLLLNPPFHRGTAVDLSLVGPLLEAAHRLLAPDGRLYLVHNSHARYRPQVAQWWSQVRQLVRTPVFTVLTASNQHEEPENLHSEEQK